MSIPSKSDRALKIVVHVNHPAHVHLFKNFIWEIQKLGHHVDIIATKKNVTFELLNKYNFTYYDLGSYGDTTASRIKNVFIKDFQALKIIKKINPDLFLGMGSITNSHLSKLINKPCINLTQTEYSGAEQFLLWVPFTNYILTPESFMMDLGKKQIRYNGYHELAYLHPKYFKPDPSILSEVGLSESDTFILVRFVGWDATHDRGQHGVRDKLKLINELEAFGKVFVSSEKKVSQELEKYALKIEPEKLHDLLSYATLYVGEGGSTASEAVMLGVHSVHISTLGKKGGVFYDQAKYGLQHLCETDDEALTIAKSLLSNNSLKQLGKEKRKKLLEEKIDVTGFLVKFVTDLNNR